MLLRKQCLHQVCFNANFIAQKLELINWISHECLTSPRYARAEYSIRWPADNATLVLVLIFIVHGITWAAVLLNQVLLNGDGGSTTQAPVHAVATVSQEDGRLLGAPLLLQQCTSRPRLLTALEHRRGENTTQQTDLLLYCRTRDAKGDWMLRSS